MTELGAAVVGVSADDVEAQRAFAKGQGLPYPLIPDSDGAVGKALGVGRLAGFYPRRTILVAPDGRVAKVFDDVDVKRHAEQIAEAIRRGQPGVTDPAR